MANMYPERRLINKMWPSPTPGEAFLLDFLEKSLDNSWDVYFQSSLDGSFPDIVLVRPRHGALIIEVKDWDLSIYSEDENEPRNWICHTADHKNPSKRSPLTQVKMYKDLFYQNYVRSLARATVENKKRYGLIDTALFFYNATHQQLENFFSHCQDDSSHVILLGRDDLKKEQFYQQVTKMDKYLFTETSRYFSEEICDELRTLLRPSEHAIQKLNDINWTKDQKRLYLSRAGKKQKVRGEAGCGKTIVLAHRAIDAYKKTHKPVLILTYNITLCHYIRDTINQLRHKDPEVANEELFIENFIIRHYHLFFKAFPNACDMPVFNIPKENQDNEDELAKKKQQAILDFLASKKGSFQTILVDEIQDYEEDWVDQILALAGKDTELVFFGDEEQNIYARKQVTDGNIKHRCYTGLGGNWSRIHGSHRVEGDIARLAMDFQKRYFSDYEDNLLEPSMDNLFAEKNFISYQYTDTFSPQGIINTILSFMKIKKINRNDICFLSNQVESIRKIDQLLKQSGYKTVTTFETEEEYRKLEPRLRSKDKAVKRKAKEDLDSLRRTSKMRFWMESGKIKLSTIHSYKGWGIHTEVLILDGRKDNIAEGVERLTPSLIYTGITRAKKNLIIINLGGWQYHPFFQKYFQQ